jgi:tetratricopeptide (TPR) repeat protein
MSGALALPWNLGSWSVVKSDPIVAGPLDACCSELRAMPPAAALELASHHAGGGRDPVDIAHRAGGWPLLVVELARSPPDPAGRTGGTGRTGEDVPSAARRAVERRLAGVDAAVGRLLRTAAVLGGRFRADVLARVTGTALDEVIARLDPAVTAQLLTEDPGQLGRYRFGHDLVAEALRATTGRNASAALHRRAGAALAELAAGDDDPAWIEAATHLALGGGQRADVFAAAGRIAARRADPAAAAEWFERALDCLGSLDRPDGGDENVDAAAPVELLIALGAARDRARHDGARRAYLDAARRARQAGLDDLLVGTAVNLTRYHQARITARPDREVIETVELALERTDDPGRVARLKAALCAELLWTGRLDRRLHLAGEAAAAARRAAAAPRRWPTWWAARTWPGRRPKTRRHDSNSASKPSARCRPARASRPSWPGSAPLTPPSSSATSSSPRGWSPRPR